MVDLASLGQTALRTATSVIGGRGEPQRNYLWEVFPTNSKMDAALQIFAKSVSIPNQSSETMEYNFMGDKFMFQGKDSSSKTTNITFWDNQRLNNYKNLLEWFYISSNRLDQGYTGAQVDKTGPHGYAGNLHIRLLDVTTYQYTAEFILRNAFPTEIGEISLSYEGDLIEFNATFAFDWFDSGSISGTSTFFNVVNRIENVL